MSQDSSFEVVIYPKGERSLADSFRELCYYRELLWVLAYRTISIRFAQTALGVAWVVVQPVLLTIIFTLVFGFLARVPSNPGLPYPLLVFSGLLLWQYFCRCVTDGGSALQSNSHIITKVYFPRVLVLMVPPLAGALDLVVGFGVLFCLMAWYDAWQFSFTLLALPLIVIGTGILGFGVSLVLAPMGIRRRDIMIALPFFLQLGMYVTPVIYPISFIPEKYQWILYLNPMATLIDCFRWALFGSPSPSAEACILAVLIGLFFLILGRVLFRRAESSMVDEI